MFEWLLLAQVADLADAVKPLTSTGLAVMVVSVGGVLCLLSFCLVKVLTLPPVEREEDDYHPPRPLSM